MFWKVVLGIFNGTFTMCAYILYNELLTFRTTTLWICTAGTTWNQFYIFVSDDFWFRKKTNNSMSYCQWKIFTFRLNRWIEFIQIKSIQLKSNNNDCIMIIIDRTWIYNSGLGFGWAWDWNQIKIPNQYFGHDFVNISSHRVLIVDLKILWLVDWAHSCLRLNYVFSNKFTFINQIVIFSFHLNYLYLITLLLEDKIS